MKLVNINTITKLLGLIFLIFSCTSDLDFDQIDDLKLKPVLVANLIYFDIPANAFTKNGIEQIFINRYDDFNN